MSIGITPREYGLDHRHGITFSTQPEFADKLKSRTQIEIRKDWPTLMEPQKKLSIGTCSREKEDRKRKRGLKQGCFQDKYIFRAFSKTIFYNYNNKQIDSSLI